jgi:hypothetical protein
MTENTVSQLPSNDTINENAKAIAAMMMQVATFEERQPIVDYGRCLLAKVEPPSNFTLRFFAGMSKLAPRLPDYQTFTRDNVMYESAISTLQCRIAVIVVRHEYDSAVLR